MLQLLAEILEIESPPFLDFFRQLFGFAMINFPLDLFDQRQHVAHTQDAGCQPVWVERIQGVGFFAYPEEFDGTLGNRAHRKCGTTPGIRVDLSQNDAGEWQRLAEGLGGVGGILTGHRIDNEQRFDRVDRFMQGFNLGHHFFINSKPTCRIDQ